MDLRKNNAEREFNAYLQLVNTDAEQKDFAGTNLSVEIKNTKWKCYLSENVELIGEAYPIITKGEHDEEIPNWNLGMMPKRPTIT